jgi:hypothetical protein
VLASAIAFQGFKLIAGRGSKILQLSRRVEIPKLSASDLEKI